MKLLFGLFFIFSACVFADPQITFKRKGKIIKSYSLEELTQMNSDVEITVFEPHDKTIQTFKGFAVSDLFAKVYGEDWKKEEEALFTCVDGYRPSVPMTQFEKYPAYLVYKRSPSNDFTLHPQQKNMDEPSTPLGPFYLVWDNQKFPELKEHAIAYWPYQVTMVDLVAFSDQFKAMAPPAKSKPNIKKGFLVFRSQCMECHTINGEGYNKGVELNYPMSVTEYWSEKWLKKYILEPQTMRHGTPMRPFSQQSKEWKTELKDVMAYLKEMAKNKKKEIASPPAGARNDGAAGKKRRAARKDVQKS